MAKGRSRLPLAGFHDQRYFEAADVGWLVVTNRGKPLLTDGRFPMFWSRAVAKLYLQQWMVKSQCRIVRAEVFVKRPRSAKQTAKGKG